MNKYIIFLMSVTALCQCSKKNDSEEKPVCRLSTITDQDGGVINFTYDEGGRISIIDHPGANPYSRVFTYIGNTEYIKFSSGVFELDDTITLDDAGRFQKAILFDGTSRYVRTFFYDEAGLIRKTVTQVNNGSPETQVFTSGNGDITQVQTGSSTTTYEYDLDKTASETDYLGILRVLYPEYFYAKSAHRLKAQKIDAEVSNFNYAEDGEGKISSVNITSSTPVQTLGFQYVCN